MSTRNSWVHESDDSNTASNDGGGDDCNVSIYFRSLLVFRASSTCIILEQQSSWSWKQIRGAKHASSWSFGAWPRLKLPKPLPRLGGDWVRIGAYFNKTRWKTHEDTSLKWWFHWSYLLDPMQLVNISFEVCEIVASHPYHIKWEAMWNIFPQIMDDHIPQ